MEETTLYAEDFSVGDTFTFGSHTVSKAEIVEFASKYDPQPFHVDEDAASESMFGGLIASGWHVVSLTQRLVTDALYGQTALRGGKRTDDVIFHAPTRPGDTLSGTVEVVDVSDPPNRPDQRDIAVAISTQNGEGTTVLSMTSHPMVARRE